MEEEKVMTDKEWRSLSPESQHSINILGSKLTFAETHEIILMEMIKSLYEALKKVNAVGLEESSDQVCGNINAVEEMFPEVLHD